MNWFRQTIQRHRRSFLTLLTVNVFFMADGTGYVHAHELKQHQHEQFLRGFSQTCGVPIERLRPQVPAIGDRLEEVLDDRLAPWAASGSSRIEAWIAELSEQFEESALLPAGGRLHAASAQEPADSGGASRPDDDAPRSELPARPIRPAGKEKAAAGRTSNMSFDAAGRLIRFDRPDGLASENVFDAGERFLSQMITTLSSFTGRFVSALVALSLGGCAEEPPKRAQSSDRAAVAASEALTLSHELPAGVAILGAPIEWSLVVENRGAEDLKTGSWIATPSCEVLWWMAGIDYSLIDLDLGETLELAPLLPEPADFPPGLWLEPGDQRTLVCDLTEVFPLDRAGRYELNIEVAGLPFAIAADETRRLEDATVFRTLPQSRQSEFEIRRLTGEEQVAWRQQAGDGDVTAIRVVGAHRDLHGLVDLERATRSDDANIRRAAVSALVRLPTAAATDALGRAIQREVDPNLKEQMAWLMVEDREELEASPWVLELGKDTIVFHDFEWSGQTYRHYRLRRLAKDFFSRRSEPLVEVQVEEAIREVVRDTTVHPTSSSDS